MIIDYSKLLNIIANHYDEGTIEQKINRLSKESKIKVYRFKRILEGVKRCYFNVEEIITIGNILKVKDLQEVFLTQKEQ